jgi:hypothetical protein
MLAFAYYPCCLAYSRTGSPTLPRSGHRRKILAYINIRASVCWCVCDWACACAYAWSRECANAMGRVRKRVGTRVRVQCTYSMRRVCLRKGCAPESACTHMPSRCTCSRHRVRARRRGRRCCVSAIMHRCALACRCARASATMRICA